MSYFTEDRGPVLIPLTPQPIQWDYCKDPRDRIREENGRDVVFRQATVFTDHYYKAHKEVTTEVCLYPKIDSTMGGP